MLISKRTKKHQFKNFTLWFISKILKKKLLNFNEDERINK